MQTERIIRKHVAIIHAYSLMSALQRKVVNVLLYEAVNENSYLNHKDSVAIECRMPFLNLMKAVNFNSNNTQYLKEAIDGLASLKIEWNLLKDKVPSEISFLNLRVLHGPPTFYQDGTFNFSFHKVMLDLVGNPPIYGTIDLQIQSQFESKYAHSLYENSTRFVNLQKNKVIQLDVIRKLLGVHQDKYPSMREMTRNVLTPALEEVNERAGFIVNLEGIKIGKKIVGFELSVNSKKKSIPDSKPAKTSEEEQVRYKIAQIFGTVCETVLNNIQKNYSEEYILEKIAYTKKHAKCENSGFYPIPYFISALRDDYKASALKQEDVQAEKPIDYEKEWNKQLASLKADLIHWKRNFEYAKLQNNHSVMNNAQGLVLKCEEELQQHQLQKSKEIGSEELI